MKLAASSVQGDADPLPAVPNAKALVGFVEPAGAHFRLDRALPREAHPKLFLTIPPMPAQLFLRGWEFVLPGHGSRSFRLMLCPPAPRCNQGLPHFGQPCSQILRHSKCEVLAGSAQA